MNIDPIYQNAINSWTFDTSVEAPPTAVDIVTKKVTESMRAVLQLKGQLGLTTEGMIYAVALDKDRQSGHSTPDKLAQATPTARSILSKVHERLEPGLGTEAKVATLFFGIWHVEQALTSAPEKRAEEMTLEERIATLEANVTQLNSMAQTLPPGHFMKTQVDASLQKARDTLNALYAQLAAAS